MTDAVKWVIDSKTAYAVWRALFYSVDVPRLGSPSPHGDLGLIVVDGLFDDLRSGGVADWQQSFPTRRFMPEDVFRVLEPMEHR